MLFIVHQLRGAEDRDDSAHKSDRHGRHEEPPGVDGFVMKRSEFLLQHFPYDIGQNLVDVRIAPSEKDFLLFVTIGNESFEGRQSVNFKRRFELREASSSNQSIHFFYSLNTKVFVDVRCEGTKFNLLECMSFHDEDDEDFACWLLRTLYGLDKA